MTINSIAIIGASAAGVACAATLREEGFGGAIAVFGDESRFPYERPAVSKGLLTGEIAAPPPIAAESFFRESAIDLRLGVNVMRVHVGEMRIETAGSSSLIKADRIIIATGARPRRLRPDLGQLEGVYALRDADSAAAVRARLARGANVVVVGGGLVGAEAAAAASAMGTNVTWLEQDRRFLGVLGPEASEALTALHLTNGVRMRAGARVSRVIGASRVTEIELDDGARLPADLVIVGVGVLPNKEIAPDLAVGPRGGLAVDESGRTGAESVFACGDVCDPPETLHGAPRPEHWRAAQTQGAAVARAILAVTPRPAEPNWFWSDQYDAHVEGVGVRDPHDDVVVRRYQDGVSVFYFRGGAVTGAVSVNQARDVRWALRAIKSKGAVDREMLANPAVNIQSLAARAR